MGFFADWLSYIPLIIAIFAIVYVPGFATGRALGASRYLAFVTAPALTYAIVGVSGIVFGTLGIAWNLVTFLAATVVFVAVGAGIGRLRAMARINTQWELDQRSMTREQRRLHRATLIIGALFVIVPVLFLADPAVPSSQADPMFHYNGVNAIVMSENASAIEAMGANHGVRVLPSTYPTVWHAILALLGNSHIMPATHGFAYVVLPIIWVVGMDFFVRTTLPRHTWAWVVGPVLGAVLPYMPDFLSVSRGFWPNAIAIAVIPVIYGWGALTLRTLPASRKRHVVVPSLTIAVSVLGMGLAHPGAVFAALWPLVPLVAVLAAVGALRGIRDQSKPWLTVAAVSLLGLIAGSVLLLHPRVQLFLDRPHPRSWDTRERLETLGNTLAGVNPVLIGVGALLGVAALALIFAAVRATWRVREARWLVIAWFAQLLVVFGAYVDGNVFATIAGIWYHDPKRAMAILTIFTTAILALAVDRWIHSRPRQTNAIIAGAMVAALTLGAVLRVGSVYQDARPPIGSEKIIDSRDEIALLEDLDEVLPEGSVIIGDATTGIGYAPSYSRVNVVFPQVNYRSSDVNGLFLRENFHDIHTDPYVCQILTQYGIGYYYEDDPLVYQKRDRSETWPGLYDVDTSRGFTKIAESDGGTLWRIDACGTMGEPDWWDLDARFETLPRADQ